MEGRNISTQAPIAPSTPFQTIVVRSNNLNGILAEQVQRLYKVLEKIAGSRPSSRGSEGDQEDLPSFLDVMGTSLDVRSDLQISLTELVDRLESIV